MKYVISTSLKKSAILFASLLSVTISLPTLANSIHFSAEGKVGPTMGFDLVGYGGQLGVTDTLGFEAIYFSYSQSEGTLLPTLNRTDHELNTYRIGVEKSFQSIQLPLQFEIGLAEYEGERRYWASGDHEQLSATGASIAISAVHNFTEKFALRVGADLNFFGSDNTYYSTSGTVLMIGAGVIIRL